MFIFRLKLVVLFIPLLLMTKKLLLTTILSKQYLNTVKLIILKLDIYQLECQ